MKMLDTIIGLLQEILRVAREMNEHLANLDVLGARRKRHAEIVKAGRAKKANVTSHENVTSQKEERTEREDLPPEPPIGEKGKREEIYPPPPACARDVVDDFVNAIPYPTSPKEVKDFFARMHFTLDPEKHFSRLCEEPDAKRVRNWKARAQRWDKNGIPWGRVNSPAGSTSGNRSAARERVTPIGMIIHNQSMNPDDYVLK